MNTRSAKLPVKKIGSDYVPPEIREVPTVAGETVTVHFKSPLREGQRDSLMSCFKNFCTRHQVNPRIIIRGQTITIDGAPEKVIREALYFLEIDKLPEAKTPATPVKPRPMNLKPPQKQRRGTGLNGMSRLARNLA